MKLLLATVAGSRMASGALAQNYPFTMTSKHLAKTGGGCTTPNSYPSCPSLALFDSAHWIIRSLCNQ
jgi:hypothetical protein